MFDPRTRVSRRTFLRMSAERSAGLAAAGVFFGAGIDLLSEPRLGESAVSDDWNALRKAPEVTPQGLTLHAAEGMADIGGGVRAEAWMLNESLPSPLLRVRRGERFQVTLRNDLEEDLILHWHGLTPPEHSDGHPRLAVPPGGTYEYEFDVEDRAGTYWYHSHAHMNTARHTYLGIAGMVIVEDPEEDALGLPTGDREIPIILQDRQLDSRGQPVYNTQYMAGMTGEAPFGNGIFRPEIGVDTALYRLRILNASTARIFRLERNDGLPLILIGNDGGLLERSYAVESLDLSPAERVDVLVDLRDLDVGQRVVLRSAAISMDGLEARSAGSVQGQPMDLLRLRVDRKVKDKSTIPTVLSAPRLFDPVPGCNERTFALASARDAGSRTMMTHEINGHSFKMDRVDEKVKFGETEIWSFENDDGFAHPIHLHGTHFRVLSRTGGRGEVFPWETGLKDTVLLLPTETVRIAVRYDAHRGLFPLHCHNLDHEDVGMMLNVLVE